MRQQEDIVLHRGAAEVLKQKTSLADSLSNGHCVCHIFEPVVPQKDIIILARWTRICVSSKNKKRKRQFISKSVPWLDGASGEDKTNEQINKCLFACHPYVGILLHFLLLDIRSQLLVCTCRADW